MLDVADQFGVTPLFSAVMCGMLLNYYLSKQEKNNLFIKKNNYILYLAPGSHECAELLLQRGANVNEKTIQNPAVPLHEASGRGDFKMCELLLQYKVGLTVYYVVWPTVWGHPKFKKFGKSHYGANNE